MEQHVAAAAQAEEVLVPRDPGKQLVLRCRADRRTSGANAGRRSVETVRGDELARVHQVLAPAPAIEPDAHEAARLDQPGEHAPAGERIFQVVQHAGGFDQMEALAQ